jgi:hypothetical protein
VHPLAAALCDDGVHDGVRPVPSSRS